MQTPSSKKEEEGLTIGVMHADPDLSGTMNVQEFRAGPEMQNNVR